MENLLQDVRHAIRSLSKNTSFTAATILTLALGIGANTAIFSVVSGVVLRPLPFPNPERLVRIYETSPLLPEGGSVALGTIEEFRRQARSLEAVVGYEVSARYLHAASEVQRVMAVVAERDLFSILGIGPIAGRTFRPDDPPDVAVVSEAFWKRLGGGASIVGSSIVLDDRPVTIVGVMPESFQFPYRSASLLSGSASQGRTDLWLTMTPPAQVQQRARVRIGSVAARLRPNVSLSAAESELAVIAKNLLASSPEANRGRGVRLVPLAETVVGASVRRPLFILLAAVGLVLALACANLINLSLVRTTRRSREVAVRTALGASPGRLARQFVTESVVLVGIGAAAGLGLAWWSVGRLIRLAGAQIPRAHEIGFDWRVFLFLCVVCTLTAVGLGLAPLLVALRTDTRSVLQDADGHTTMGLGARRLRDGLVVAEIALAFALAIGATLLVRELVRLRRTDTGMATANVMTFHVGHRMTPRSDPGQYYEIADRVMLLPGVRAAGFTQMLPLQNWGWTSNSADFRIRGEPAPQTSPYQIELRYVTPGYFEALGIPIRKGRGFTARDTRGAPPVILINEVLARRSFGGEDPIGRETTRGTIAGIVADVRQVTLDRAAHPEIYYPIAQNWAQVSELGMSLVVRTEKGPEAVIEPVRAAVRAVNPDLAVFNIRTMDGVIADWLADFTLYLALMATFASVALLLAATGTYGVIAFAAASRTRELAIRIALGADAGRVARLVLRHAVLLAALGLACGTAAALALTPLLRNLPIAVRPPDVRILAPVALLIGAVAIAASLAPARRAARADPMALVRRE